MKRVMASRRRRVCVVFVSLCARTRIIPLIKGQISDKARAKKKKKENLTRRRDGGARTRAYTHMIPTHTHTHKIYYNI